MTFKPALDSLSKWYMWEHLLCYKSINPYQLWEKHVAYMCVCAYCQTDVHKSALDKKNDWLELKMQIS